MSRAELTDLLERGAGPAPDAPDTTALWQRGRHRRRAKRTTAVGMTAAVAVGVVAVQPVWDGAVPDIDLTPADAPATADLPTVVLPDPGGERAELAPLVEPTGSLLVATYDGSATFVDVDRREVTDRELPELATGDPPYRLIAGDRLVLWGGQRTYAMDPDPDAEPEPIVDETTSSVFVPAGVPDRFWIRLGTTDGSPAPISQVAVDGQVLLGPTESPAGNLVAGLRDTVVLQRDGELLVWDPQTDQVAERIPGVFPMGSDGDRFAWCDQGCRQLSITDPVAGTTRLLARVPDGATFSGYGGQLSPDGRFLAAPLCVDGGRRCGLAVLDLHDDRATIVADGWVSSTARPAWSPDSHRVFVVLEDDRLATYRPGTPDATIVQIDGIAATYGVAVAVAGDEPDALRRGDAVVDALREVVTAAPESVGEPVLNEAEGSAEYPQERPTTEDDGDARSVEYAATVNVYEWSDSASELALIESLATRLESESEGWPAGSTVGIVDRRPEGGYQVLVALNGVTMNITSRTEAVGQHTYEWAMAAATAFASR